MTQYDTSGPRGTGERWNVNMPAVIGVVFLFLVGVIVWVVASGGGDDPAAEPGDSTEVTTTLAGATTIPPSTTPAMPSTTLAATTLPESTTSTSTTSTSTTTPQPTTTVPVTTAPGSDPGAVPGDLGIPGRPMRQPPCNGGFITIIASAVGDQATADGIAAVLETYEGSEYLRTDQTCSSLRADVDGQPIYVVYFGPFPFDTDACIARADGPDGAYVKQLSDEIPPDQVVVCS